MSVKRLQHFYDSGAHQTVYPVHKGSTRLEVKFAPITRRQASKLFHDARRFERSTRNAKNRQDGKLGRNALFILHAMLFDFIDRVSGRLDPSYAAIADRANISVRSVARGLVKLRDAGVLYWKRRCTWQKDGTVSQDTNAYGVHPQDQWNGYAPPAPPPIAPDRGTWGDHPPSPSPLELAAEKASEGDTKGAQAALELETDPLSLGAALARFGAKRSAPR